MKRIFSIMLAAAVAAMAFVACTDDTKEDEGNKTVEVTEVTLSETTLSFTVGDAAKTITATVAPDNATEKTVTWDSNKPEVATVADGVVTPVGAGVATITATAGGKTAKCKVTVEAAAIKVTAVSISEKRISLGIGAVYELTAFVEPEDADNPIVEWESSDETVATVDESGNVKGISEGVATITVTTIDGGFSETCAVAVSPAIIELNADMIYTSAPMLYVCVLQGYDHEDGMGGIPNWADNWANEGGDWESMMATREARYGLAENMWDDDPETCFMTNTDIWAAAKSWVQSDRGVGYHYIDINFDEPVKNIKLYFKNASKYTYITLDNGFRIWKSTDGDEFVELEESPFYPEGGVADSNGASAEATVDNISDELGIRAIRIDANGRSNTAPDYDWTGNGAAFGIAELKIWRLK